MDSRKESMSQAAGRHSHMIRATEAGGRSQTTGGRSPMTGGRSQVTGGRSQMTDRRSQMDRQLMYIPFASTSKDKVTEIARYGIHNKVRFQIVIFLFYSINITKPLGSLAGREKCSLISC